MASKLPLKRPIKKSGWSIASPLWQVPSMLSGIWGNTPIAFAISNQRILNVDPTHVTFVAKDYRDRAQKKPVSLTGEEFLRRFSLHVMPDGYVRIRRFGIYHHSTKLHLDLQFAPDEKPDIEQMAADQNDETASERILRLTGFDLTKCPRCKEGRLIVIRTLPRIRSPAGNLPSLLFAKLQ